jgi:hypothetical protein
MSLNISTSSVHEIIAAILLLAIIIVVARFFGNIFYALFCYGIICCCKKQESPITPIVHIAPISNNDIHTIIPFAQVIHTEENNDSYSIPIATECNK